MIFTSRKPQNNMFFIFWNLQCVFQKHDIFLYALNDLKHEQKQKQFTLIWETLPRLDSF